MAHILDLETEDVEMTWDEGLTLILEHPEVLDEELRLEALASLGPLQNDEVYSLKIEEIVGGQRVVGNMRISTLRDHLQKVHVIIEAVRHDPVGTVYGAVGILRS